jgi:hypothetical protein
MTPAAIRPAAPSLRRLRAQLVLVATLLRFRDPIATAERLRRSIEVVVQWADFVGIDPPFADRLPSIQPDLVVLRILLAIIQDALRLPVAADVAPWFPKAIRVIALARRPDT